MAAISSLYTPNPTSNFPFSNPISSQTSFLKSHQNPNLQLPINHLSRREFLNGSVVLLPLAVSPPPPSQAREVEVGSYLPVSPTDPSFVLFKATPKDTPALRAGSTLKSLLELMLNCSVISHH